MSYFVKEYNIRGDDPSMSDVTVYPSERRVNQMY